jgi:hypothetical protein
MYLFRASQVNQDESAIDLPVHVLLRDVQDKDAVTATALRIHVRRGRASVAKSALHQLNHIARTVHVNLRTFLHVKAACLVVTQPQIFTRTIQEVVDALLIDLNAVHLQYQLDVLVGLHLFNAIEEVSDQARTQTLVRRIFNRGALHGVGLARTCLAVREYCCIKSAQYIYVIALSISFVIVDTTHHLRVARQFHCRPVNTAINGLLSIAIIIDTHLLLCRCIGKYTIKYEAMKIGFGRANRMTSRMGLKLHLN